MTREEKREALMAMVEKSGPLPTSALASAESPVPLIVFEYIDGPSHVHEDGSPAPCPKCMARPVPGTYDETLVVAPDEAAWLRGEGTRPELPVDSPCCHAVMDAEIERARRDGNSFSTAPFVGHLMDEHPEAWRARLRGR